MGRRDAQVWFLEVADASGGALLQVVGNLFVHPEQSDGLTREPGAIGSVGQLHFVSGRRFGLRYALAGHVPRYWALGLALGGGIADLAIGGALLVRRWVRPACFAALFLSAAYLVVGTMLTPYLWADPLGPFVKIFPGMALALGIAALSENR